jgi:2-polyprenyl-6-methoxyphenol hydroxylase-like FAD-dependent oxidoreductase
MLNAAIDKDVLIVGAGPVGLFLANECARRGMRWRLVETLARLAAEKACWDGGRDKPDRHRP